ncbi:MAG: CBO2463/CBO2479 domain-containing protein [Senegalia sp. (in: firmicutes)]
MKVELKPNLLKGNLIGVSDRGVKIELLGRMGIIILPRRSIITNKDLKEGDQVEIYLSYAQVIDN